MQSDQKIGLCLLIAICGFTAALGFGRRERSDLRGSRNVELATADELLTSDDLSGSQTVDASPTVALQTVELSPAGEAIIDTHPVEPEQHRGEASFVPAFEPPLPISRAVPESPVSGPLPIGSQNRRFERFDMTLRPSHPAGEKSEPAFREYVVRAGDTLSGIASRELGDVGRYYDVFEANRDLLAHPDALRVGQKIRIPGPPAVRTANTGDQSLR